MMGLICYIMHIQYNQDICQDMYLHANLHITKFCKVLRIEELTSNKQAQLIIRELCCLRRLVGIIRCKQSLHSVNFVYILLSNSPFFSIRSCSMTREIPNNFAAFA